MDVTPLNKTLEGKVNGQKNHTHLKFNIAPENGWLEDKPFGKVYNFSGANY